LKTVKALPKPIAIPTLSAPADVIRNRPDVQVAERELGAATALHAEAFTDLFPKLSLASFFGIDGARIGQAVPTWGVTSALSLPLLNFGRIQGEIKGADARQQQALFNYRRTVLNAISDVETSLTNVAKANTSVVSLQDSIKSANQTLSIAQDRYKSGLSNFTDVLDAQQQLYSARTNLVEQQAALLTYITALHKALAIQ
jgi:multidrug efflux system outer membrane protein